MSQEHQTSSALRYYAKCLTAVAFVGIFLALQFSLWFGDNTVSRWLGMRADNAEQAAENAQLAEVNERLSREVLALLNNNAMVEELAREELDMVRENEVFFRFVRPQSERQ